MTHGARPLVPGCALPDDRRHLILKRSARDLAHPELPRRRARRRRRPARPGRRHRDRRAGRRTEGVVGSEVVRAPGPAGHPPGQAGRPRRPRPHLPVRQEAGTCALFMRARRAAGDWKAVGRFRARCVGVSRRRFPSAVRARRSAMASPTAVVPILGGGPAPTRTGRMFGVLARNRVPAAFSVRGEPPTASAPGVARAAAAAGHEVGLPVFAHADLTHAPRPGHQARRPDRGKAGPGRATGRRSKLAHGMLKRISKRSDTVSAITNR